MFEFFFLYLYFYLQHVGIALVPLFISFYLLFNIKYQFKLYQRPETFVHCTLYNHLCNTNTKIFDVILNYLQFIWDIHLFITIPCNVRKLFGWKNWQSVTKLHHHKPSFQVRCDDIKKIWNWKTLFRFFYEFFLPSWNTIKVYDYFKNKCSKKNDKEQKMQNTFFILRKFYITSASVLFFVNI